MLASLGLLICHPAAAQSNALAAAAGVANHDQATLDKRVRPIMTALQLNDADKEAKVRAVATTYFQTLKSWHAENDPQIKPLWNQFNAARSKQNAADANATLAKIADVYAGFKPQHDAFLAGLASVLTSEQVELVKDTLTVKKVKVTYDVYLQIFPQLTEEQKAVVLKELKAAREEAIDCESMTEKSAFFKKHKIRIEDDYLRAQGYDPQQARKDFATKQAGTTAKTPDDADK